MQIDDRAGAPLLVAQRPSASRGALKITSSVCEGLYYAHQKADLYGKPLNIVHRDVSPEKRNRPAEANCRTAR